nr:hypothetical protein [Candidatus Sigynarchaeota archaeon]
MTEVLDSADIIIPALGPDPIHLVYKGSKDNPEDKEYPFFFVTVSYKGQQIDYKANIRTLCRRGLNREHFARILWNGFGYMLLIEAGDMLITREMFKKAYLFESIFGELDFLTLKKIINYLKEPSNFKAKIVSEIEILIPELDPVEPIKIKYDIPQNNLTSDDNPEYLAFSDDAKGIEVEISFKRKTELFPYHGNIRKVTKKRLMRVLVNAIWNTLHFLFDWGYKSLDSRKIINLFGIADKYTLACIARYIEVFFIEEREPDEPWFDFERWMKLEIELKNNEEEGDNDMLRSIYRGP